MEIKTELDQRGKSILDFTIKLMEIKSVSNTSGVREAGEYLYNYLDQWNYFQENPGYLKKVYLPGDGLGRFNILALVRGEKESSSKTVVYLSHMDTVGTGDYGDLEDLACEPLKLMKALQKQTLPREVKEELNSGNWLFGRGSADMKSGIALELELLREFVAQVDELKGNILLAITVNEEADSRGILALVRPLISFANKHHLKLLGGINTDYTTREQGNDKNVRYFYPGSVGKIVPALYVVGRPSHIGQVFEGIDINLFLSNMTREIDYNMEFADSYRGQITNPPISLKQGDLKDEYNAQLPYEGFAYYNFMNFKRTSGEIMAIFRRIAEKCLQKTLKQVKENCQKYYQRLGMEEEGEEIKGQVFIFSRLVEIVKRKTSLRKIKRIKEEMGKTDDPRKRSLAIVRRIWKASGLKGPAVVIFLVPPYYPAHNPDYEEEKFQLFNEKLKAFTSKKASEISCRLKLKEFFPYLSDASFTVFQEGKENQQVLKANMPVWGKDWGMDIEALKELNLPIVNMGVYGKDAHKALERLYLPYSLQVLPELVKEFTLELLKGTEG